MVRLNRVAGMEFRRQVDSNDPSLIHVTIGDDTMEDLGYILSLKKIKIDIDQEVLELIVVSPRTDQLNH